MFPAVQAALDVDSDVRHSQYMVTVRNDLERIRMLVELVRKREKDKLRQARILKDLLEEILFPHDGKLRLAYEKIVG